MCAAETSCIDELEKEGYDVGEIKVSLKLVSIAKDGYAEVIAAREGLENIRSKVLHLKSEVKSQKECIRLYSKFAFRVEGLFNELSTQIYEYLDKRLNAYTPNKKQKKPLNGPRDLAIKALVERLRKDNKNKKNFRNKNTFRQLSFEQAERLLREECDIDLSAERIEAIYKTCNKGMVQLEHGLVNQENNDD